MSGETCDGVEPRRALVLGGGGILGAAFEIGVLAALEERFGEGCIFRSFDLFVGTSAGSFVASLVGQGFPPRRLFSAYVEGDPSLLVRAHDVYSISWGRLFRGSSRFLATVGGRALRSLIRLRMPPFLDLVACGLATLPAGFLSIEALDRYLCRIFEREGLSNSFAELAKPIFIPALDLDAAAHRIFGENPGDDPTVCQAVMASSAIPQLFGPVQVGSRFFVDGAVGGGAHLDVALQHAASEILLINPLVASCAAERDAGNAAQPGCRLVSRGGLGAVLDQCLKLEHERAVADAVRAVKASHTGVEVALIQPRREVMFPQRPMEYGAYQEVLRLGYVALQSLEPVTLNCLSRLVGAGSRRAVSSPPGHLRPERRTEGSSAPEGWRSDHAT